MSNQVTRRTILGGLTGAAMYPLVGQAADIPSELYEAAKKDGEVNWYVSAFSTADAERIKTAFAARYPGITINIQRQTAGTLFQRVSEELRANSPLCNVLSTTGTSSFFALRDAGQLVEYRPRNLDTMLDAYREPKIENYLQMVSATVMAIGYNTKGVPAAEAPKSWLDLTQPKWKGKLVVCHPAFQGSSVSWCLVMQKLYGNSFFTKLKDVQPQMARSLVDTSTLVASGERQVGISYVGGILETASKGNPVGLVYPTDGIVIADSYTTILKGRKNLNASKLLNEFLLSPEVSAITVKTFGETLHKGVAPAASSKPLSEVKYHRLPAEELVKGERQIKEMWRDTFGI